MKRDLKGEKDKSSGQGKMLKAEERESGNTSKTTKSWQVLGRGNRYRGERQTKTIWEELESTIMLSTGCSEEFGFILSGG